MDPDPEKIVDRVQRFEEALAQQGLRPKSNLVPFGDGHLHSVEEVVAFIEAADEDADGWEQVTGFFHQLGDLDSKWNAIRRVADSTDDPSKLVAVAVFAFEALIEETRDELPARLEIAAESPCVRKMLASCWVSMRYDGIIGQYADRTSIVGSDSSGDMGALLSAAPIEGEARRLARPVSDGDSPVTSTPASDLSAMERDRLPSTTTGGVEVWDLLSESHVSIEISSEGTPVRVAFRNPRLTASEAKQSCSCPRTTH